MKITSSLLLSIAAAIAFAHQPTKTKSDHPRDLYARNSFAEKRVFPVIGDLLGSLDSLDGAAQSTDEPSKELLKRGITPEIGGLPDTSAVSGLLNTVTSTIPLKKRVFPVIGDLLGSLDSLGDAAQSTDEPSKELLKRGITPEIGGLPDASVVSGLLNTVTSTIPLKKRVFPVIGDLLGSLDSLGGAAQSTDEPPKDVLKRGLPIIDDLLEGPGGVAQGGVPGSLLKKRGVLPGLGDGIVPDVGGLPGLDVVGGLANTATRVLPIKRGLPGSDALPLGMVSNLVQGAVPNVGSNKNVKRNDDFSDADFEDECEKWADEDHGHNRHHNNQGNHHGRYHDRHHSHHHVKHHGHHHGDHHGNDGPCDCDRGYQGNSHRGRSSHGNGVDLDLDGIVKAKVDIIAKAFIGITVDALIDIKADIYAKVLLKLDLDVGVDVDLAAKIKAIVKAKVDAAVKVYVNAGIKASIGDSVRHHCHSGCSSDADSGILGDVTARLKLDIGKILGGLDVDILADIRVNLASLGLHIKADVAQALGLNLHVILGNLANSCKDASSGILIKLKAAVHL